MKKQTIKKMLAGVMTLALMAAFMMPVVVGAQGEEIDFATVASEGGLGNANLSSMISGVIKVVMGFLGVIAVLIILWGGFIWMTAMGEPDKIEKAKNMIKAGVIGLVIIFASYAIASFVMSNLGAISQTS